MQSVLLGIIALEPVGTAMLLFLIVINVVVWFLI